MVGVTFSLDHLHMRQEVRKKRSTKSSSDTEKTTVCWMFWGNKKYLYPKLDSLDKLEIESRIIVFITTFVRVFICGLFLQWHCQWINNTASRENLTVDNKLERTWHEVAVAYFKVLSHICLEALRQITKNLSHYSRCTDRGSNQA
jgi:hypothetical protein